MAEEVSGKMKRKTPSPPLVHYCLAPQLSFRILSAIKAQAKIADREITIPLDHLQLLMYFAEPRSIAEVHAMLHAVASMQELTSLTFSFLSRGLLVEATAPSAAPSLLDSFDEKYQKPELWRAISDKLAAGHCVILRDAMAPAFAEKMFRCLDEFDGWRPNEDYQQPTFAFRQHNILGKNLFPPDLTECDRIFASAATKAFMESVSRRDCRGETTFSATRFLPGDLQLPHNDCNGLRNVTFVWHLAKNWEPKWGGSFYWCSSLTNLPPSFNTLVLFNVSPQSVHLVTAVSPYATGKRLAIHGWWDASGPENVGKDLKDLPAITSEPPSALPPHILIA